jgi:hypothetical protein
MAKEKGHMTAKLLVLRADLFVRTIEDTKGVIRNNLKTNDQNNKD